MPSNLLGTAGAVALVNFAWTATALAQSVVYDKSGWRGMVMQSSNEFRGCLATTTAARSDQLVIGQFANRAWFIGLTRTGGFRRNLQYRITLAVDGRQLLTGTSKVTDDGIAIIEPTLDPASMTALSIGNSLRIETELGATNFPLDGSADAIEFVGKCVANMSIETASSPKASGEVDTTLRVQLSLVWTGHYNGLVDGEMGAGTRRAIMAFQSAIGATPSGQLTDQQIRMLHSNAAAEMRRVGFELVSDERADLSIGLPVGLLSRKTPNRSGMSYSTPSGDYTVSTYAFAAGDTLDRVASGIEASNVVKTVGYRVLRQDRFVIAGDDGTTRTYVMAIPTPGGVRAFRSTVRIGSPFDIDNTFGRLVVLMASTLAARQQETSGRSQPAEANEPKLSSGSGILVSTDGHILTNEHVAGDCERIAVKGHGQATLVRKDKANDLAIIRIQATQGLRPAVFRIDDVDLAEPIYAFGYPLADTLSTSLKVTNGIVSSLAGVGDDSRYIQVSSPIQPGNSGGPLVDNAGLIVGVVTAKLSQVATLKRSGSLPENVGFALRSSVATAFMRSARITYETRGRETARQTGEISRAADAYTVQVVCLSR